MSARAGLTYLSYFLVGHDTDLVGVGAGGIDDTLGFDIKLLTCILI